LHCKENGWNYNTQILLYTDSLEDLRDTSEFFSRIFNVVKDDTWANLINELGDGLKALKSSNINKSRIKEGTHHFLNSKVQSEINKTRVINGTHISQNIEFLQMMSSLGKERYKTGNHIFNDENFKIKMKSVHKESNARRIADNTHNLLGVVRGFDINGNKIFITKEEYKNLTDKNNPDSLFAYHSSFEGKRRAKMR
jgi:hypothetical protein